MKAKVLIVLAAFALGALSLAACGGDDEDSADSGSESAATTTTDDSGGSGAGADSTISVAADPGGELAYTTTELTGSAGTNTLEFDNPSETEHDVVVEDESGETVGQTEIIAASTTSTDLELEPGSYTFYCSVSGHREAGMEGTLTAE